MSFDPFETRLHFLQLVRKLNASQASIQKVVSFAIKYGSRCGEDLWECVVEESSKGSLNTRINVLYFLDSLLDASSALGPTDAPYPAFVARDLGSIVGSVVPESREGVLNLKSARQILESWRTRRVIDLNVVDEVLRKLEARPTGDSSPKKRGHEEAFSRSDILRRMEEDRERHKRLRERIWILPIPSLHHPLPPGKIGPSPSSASPFTPASPAPAKMMPPPPPVPPALVHDVAEKQATALDLEFEQLWETTSDLSEEDLERMKQDIALIAEGR